MPSTSGSPDFPALPADFRLPAARPGRAVPLRGRPAVVAYLRVHLYGAAVGRSLLARCVGSVGPEDRRRLLPLRGQFDGEIEVAAQLLSRLTPFGAPGRRLLRVSSGVTLSFLPVGPGMIDPLTRLGALESLRTLVVAEKSMWLLLADWITSGGPATADDNVEGGDEHARSLFIGLADQAAGQEDLLEELRRAYGLAAFR